MSLWAGEFVYEISGWRGIIHAANTITRFVEKMDTHDVGSQEKPETTKIPLVLEIKTKDLERPDDTIKNMTISLPNGLTAKFILSGSWLVAHD
jgi:hypothetical protein